MTDIPIRYTATDNTKAASDSARRNISGVSKDAAASSRQMQGASKAAADALRGLGGEFGSIKANVGGFNSGLVSMTGVIGGVTTAVLGAGIAMYKFAQEANAFNRIKGSFDGLAASVGASSDSMLSSLQGASRGMISQHDLVLAANRAMLLGVADTEQEMAQLMEVALARGQAMGLSATQAFNDLVTGLGRMSPMILDNLGIVTGGEKVFEDYAAAIGKAADELTDAERKQALINLTIESSAQIVEDSKTTQVDSVALMKAAWADLSVEIGNATAGLVNFAAASVAADMRATTQDIKNLQETFAAPTLIEEQADALDVYSDALVRYRNLVAAHPPGSVSQVNQWLEAGRPAGTELGDLEYLYTALMEVVAAEEALADVEQRLGAARTEAMEAHAARDDAALAQMYESQAAAARNAMSQILDDQASFASELLASYDTQLQKLRDQLTVEIGFTGAEAVTDALRASMEERIALGQQFHHSEAQIAGDVLYLWAQEAEAAKTMTGNLEDAEAVAAALGTTVGQTLVPMIGELNVQTALLGETLGANIAAGAEIATGAILNFADMAGGAIGALQESLSGFMADAHAANAEHDRILGVRSRRDGSGQLPLKTRERINNTSVFGGAGSSSVAAENRFAGMTTRLADSMGDVDLAARGAAQAIGQIAPNLEGMLAQIPGLFGTSAVTQEDLDAGDKYKNKPDEYLRQLRDEVRNGKDWEGVDIGDAAAALGLDPGMAAEEILAAFEAAWANQSLFANPENLKFIDMGAVQAHIEQQLASAEGEKNLKALFGIGADEDVAAIAALGLDIQSGLSAWLAENGFDDAGSKLAAALGTGVSENSGELGGGVSKGLDNWMVSDDGTSAIKDFAERLGAEISKNLKVKPEMELPGGDDPAWDNGGAGRGNGAGSGLPADAGPTQSASSATVYVVGNRVDTDRVGRDIARRMRR